MYAREYDGKECHNASIPEDMNDAVSPVRDMLLEAVAETSEELMVNSLMEKNLLLLKFIEVLEKVFLAVM